MAQLQQAEVVLAGPNGEALIQKTPGVCGGEACIRQTRIMVWLLVALKRVGSTDAELLANYPTLTQRDLDAAWEYQRLNADEINEAIRLNERDDA
jgi:uncharacterized protein (DUF433 family)